MPHGVLAGAERRPDTRGVLAGRRARLWGRDTGGAPLLGTLNSDAAGEVHHWPGLAPPQWEDPRMGME